MGLNKTLVHFYPLSSRKAAIVTHQSCIRIKKEKGRRTGLLSTCLTET
ncbi:hypothetical protein HMPREF0201_04237 [Cedecea davisae DSM 4568]|uniref:Uncharacterized protein n=1 Tax=Cedecea davisae DSM 4568 TaxID=566551 RepID=S3JL87_9ENTR|nr:hypothetical protein HMPREF0201_04237 [Cedecea davisae DSM 4568]